MERWELKTTSLRFTLALTFDFIQPLLHKTLTERRELLREAFVPVLGEFAFANSSDSHSVEDIQTFLETSVKDGCEGLMVKMLDTADSHYEPSRRSVNWLKVCDVPPGQGPCLIRASYIS